MQTMDNQKPSMLVMLRSGIIAVCAAAPLPGRMTTAAECQYHVLSFTFSP